MIFMFFMQTVNPILPEGPAALSTLILLTALDTISLVILIAALPLEVRHSGLKHFKGISHLTTFDNATAKL